MSIILIVADIYTIEILCEILPKHKENPIISLILKKPYLLFRLFMYLTPKRLVLCTCLAVPFLMSPRIP